MEYMFGNHLTTAKICLIFKMAKQNSAYNYNLLNYIQKITPDMLIFGSGGLKLTNGLHKQINLEKLITRQKINHTILMCVIGLPLYLKIDVINAQQKAFIAPPLYLIH